jgi:DNA-binding NarL/FixJ family response regulator
MISVFIIDDHIVLAEAIRDYLEKQVNIDCVGFATTGKQGVEDVLSRNPDIALLDIGLPDINGLECAKLILADNPDQKIVCLSTFLEVSIVKKLFKLGIKGYISKATNLNELVDCINKVNQGETYLGKEIQKVYMEELNGTHDKKQSRWTYVPQLTKREEEVLKLIANEATTKEISQSLFISVNTVESHRKNLINKFQVKNSIGLVRKALELKMLS